MIIFFSFDLFFETVSLDLNENILFDLDEEKQETTMYNITFNDDGLLNIFWKGSDSNKVQKVLIYKI